MRSGFGNFLGKFWKILAYLVAPAPRSELANDLPEIQRRALKGEKP
jgi:hypothetical protein